MPFSSLFGLETAAKSLRKALSSEQLAGAYLFAGPQGVGKTALAQAFAEAAACLQPRQDPFDACGVCGSCRLAQEGTHPEIALIRPAGEQTQIWQFWDRDNKPQGILQHTISFAPSIGRRRVYIVERADTLNEAAANSLLKVLEEPPPYALFVLLTPHVSRMLPTVLSRSQIIRLMPAPAQELAGYLERTLSLAPERAATIAAYAEGRTGTALRLAKSPSVEAEIGRVLDLAEDLATAEPLRALKLGEGIRKLASQLKALTETDAAADAVSDDAGSEPGDETAAPAKEKAGRRQIGIVLEMLAVAFRDILALNVGGEEATIVHAERRARLAAAARTGSPERWMAALEVLIAARRRADQNASIVLLTDWLAVRIVSAA